MAPEINISLDQSEGSLLSDDFLDTPDDLDINVDDIETPDETDSLEFLGNGNDLEWEGNGGPCRHLLALRPPHRSLQEPRLPQACGSACGAVTRGVTHEGPGEPGRVEAGAEGGGPGPPR